MHTLSPGWYDETHHGTSLQNTPPLLIFYRQSYQATPSTVDTKESAIRLWAHECQRVFSDRFVQDAADDEGRFREVRVASVVVCGGRVASVFRAIPTTEER